MVVGRDQVNMIMNKKQNLDENADDKAGVVVEDHIVIRDKETKTEMVNKRS